jgi:hypothetical protein
MLSADTFSRKINPLILFCAADFMSMAVDVHDHIEDYFVFPPANAPTRYQTTLLRKIVQGIASSPALEWASFFLRGPPVLPP